MRNPSLTNLDPGVMAKWLSCPSCLKPWLSLPLLALLLGVAGTGCNRSKPPPPEAKPAKVIVERVIEERVLDTEDFTGRLEAFKKVEVKAQVEGRLEKINFKEGGPVEKDNVLFVVEPLPYKLDLDIAVEGVEIAKTRHDRLFTEWQRAERLYSSRSLSTEEYLSKKAEYQETKRSVAKAQKEKDRAEYHFKNTEVKAEFDGLVGKSFQDVGNLIEKNKTILTTLVTASPIYAYFDIDERTNLTLKRLKEKKAPGEEHRLKFFVALADEEKFPHEGEIDFKDVIVDPATGTLRMRGILQNDKGLFTPGMFIRVRLFVGAPRQAPVVSELAVGTDQGQKFVYVVTDKDEVEYRQVETGPLRSGRRVIEKGLKPGERVIVSGHQKVRAKDKVDPTEQEAKSSPPIDVPEASRSTDPPAVRIVEKKDE